MEGFPYFESLATKRAQFLFLSQKHENVVGRNMTPRGNEKCHFPMLPENVTKAEQRHLSPLQSEKEKREGT